METRKVQLSGGTTYTVSLPKQWANEHGVEAGNSLTLRPREDGSLVVQSIEDTTDRHQTTIDLREYGPEEIHVAIKALYVLGFDRVTLRVDNDAAACIHAAREAIQLFIGMEILEQADDRLTIQNVMTADHISVRKSIIRLELIVDAMTKDAVTAFLDDDGDLAAEVISRDDEADKLYALITRSLRRSLGTFDEIKKLDHERAGLFEHYHVARQLERIGDHARKVAERSMDVTAPRDGLADSFPSIEHRARGIRDDATDVFLSGAPIKRAYTAVSDCGEFVVDLDDHQRALYERSDAKEAYTYGIMLDSIRRIAEYGTNIAEIAIQRRYRHEHWETY